MKSCCVIGLGYIGLPTAAIIANNGIKVNGYDINKEIVQLINKGEIHINEPNLKTLVQKVVKNKFLKAYSNPVKSEIFIISVPTPFIESNNQIPIPSIEYIEQAILSIVDILEKGNLIIIESTCPVGTTEKIALILREKCKINFNDIYLSYCPERVLPGNILNELIHNDRVIGGYTKNAAKRANDFYKLYCSGQIFITDAKTAEFVKLAENSFRDVSIAFANELSILSDSLEVDINEVIKIANRHPRVNILNPGCGVGGHCIAVDPWFLVYENPQLSKLINTARKVNIEKEQWVVSKIINKIKLYKETFRKNPVVGIMGLTFKPDVDDIRESPALKISERLKSLDYSLLFCEPNINNLDSFNLVDIETILKNSDLIIFLVKHKEFLEIDLNQIQYLDFVGIKN